VDYDNVFNHFYHGSFLNWIFMWMVARATMKVSIIMSCTDRLTNLKRTLTSWSKITYPDYEFLLIDNGSKNYDGVRELSRGLLGVIPIPYPHMGVNKIWNEYGRFSDGEYVIFAMADEILSDYDIVQKMVAYGEQRCTLNAYFLGAALTDALDTIDWENNPRLIESLPGFGEFEYQNKPNRERTDASLLSHIIGWTRERWDWFGWFRNNDRGHLWLDQDVVIRSNVLGIKSQTLNSCYHQWHEQIVYPEWLAPGYHPVNERQARLLEESERDKS
jgi:glycosyltransferase involved in cell wall biosynthesis